MHLDQCLRRKDELNINKVLKLFSDHYILSQKTKMLYIKVYSNFGKLNGIIFFTMRFIQQGTSKNPKVQLINV